MGDFDDPWGFIVEIRNAIHERAEHVANRVYEAVADATIPELDVYDPVCWLVPE